jgi:IS1 family transposase
LVRIHLNLRNLIEHFLFKIKRQAAIFPGFQGNGLGSVKWLRVGWRCQSDLFGRVASKTRYIGVADKARLSHNRSVYPADIGCRVMNPCWLTSNREAAIFQINLANNQPWTILQGDVPARSLNSLFRGSNVLSKQASLFSESQKSQENGPSCRPVGPSKEAIPTWRVAFGIFYVLLGMVGIRYSKGDAVVRLFGFLCGVLGGMFILNGYIDCQPNDKRESEPISSHNGTIVLQKYLTQLYSCSTVIDMANILNTDKQIAVIGALAEGSSIRSIERMTGIHRDTIMRLGVRVGQGCATLLDAKMRDLSCHHLQFDEIWGFIGKKQRNLLVDDDEAQYGDVWTFCAIDADTKLVPSFCCGKRDAVTANAFVEDVASRMRTRVQVTTDALRLYVEAIERGFGADVDYGRVIKTYAHDDSIHPERRYSAPEIVTTEKELVNGHPDMELASTSHVERLNGTTRLHMRRLTRLTYAFSKKLENFKAAAALHFAYYNLVKRHGTLRCTPAMAAGVENTFWSVGDLVEASA